MSLSKLDMISQLDRVINSLTVNITNTDWPLEVLASIDSNPHIGIKPKPALSKHNAACGELRDKYEKKLLIEALTDIQEVINTSLFPILVDTRMINSTITATIRVRCDLYDKKIV